MGRTPRIKIKRELTDQQRAFVDHYLVTFNAMEAARSAGYSHKNSGVGTHLLDKPQIADEIRRRALAAQKRMNVTGDDVRQFHASVVWDPRPAIHGGPSMEARQRSAVELGKLLGLYTAKIEVRGSLTLVDLLLAADKSVVAEQTVPPQH